MTGADVAATMTATVVDEWVRAGVTDVVVCPGSRSTPMALAVLADGRVRVHVQVDERSAAFIALGFGLASGRPAPIVTTSGTAAVELHPAVVEAHHAAVPMIVCTADRPPELQGVGAPQTILQTGLYGASVRLAQDLAPPDPAAAGHWRSWASRAYLAATGDPAGPVHCNMAFREPLLGQRGELPAGRDNAEPWHRAASGGVEEDLAPLVSMLDGADRGVLIAGRGCAGGDGVRALGRQIGWPVLADPLSGLRGGPGSGDAGVVAAFDPLLRSDAFASQVVPAVAVQFGAAPASKVLQQWLDGSDVRRAVVGDGPELPVEGRDAAVVVRGRPDAVARRLAELVDARGDDPTLDRWLQADDAAQLLLDELLVDRLTEPAIARSVVAGAPAGARVMVSSSMPIRDLEWFGPHRDDVIVHANRGANGIDGVVSTAVGVALTGVPTIALVGDIAFLHDANALLGITRRPIDLTVVVVDNDGGGIFSFLPQAGVLEPVAFEQIFGTPHGLDLVEVAAAFGVHAASVPSLDALAEAVGAPSGPSVVVAVTSRSDNVVHHEELNGAIALRVE